MNSGSCVEPVPDRATVMLGFSSGAALAAGLALAPALAAGLALAGALLAGAEAPPPQAASSRLAASASDCANVILTLSEAKGKDLACSGAGKILRRLRLLRMTWGRSRQFKPPLQPTPAPAGRRPGARCRSGCSCGRCRSGPPSSATG